MGFISRIFGGARKARAPAPLPVKPKLVDVAPVKDVNDDAKKTKSIRAALYATEGGAAGQEILSGGTAKRPTLLGN